MTRSVAHIVGLMFISVCLEVGLSDFAAYECPFGWVGFLDHCYRFVRYPPSVRPSTKTACTADGAYVLSVNSENEHNFVIGQLEEHTEGQIKQNWWTSGHRKAPGQAEFYWEGDGSLIESVLFWINDSIPLQKDKDSVIYHYDGYKWGWILSLPKDIHPFVCEISKEDLYKISQEDRGPDYGTENPDPATINRGPILLTQPENTVYEPDAAYTYLDCLADAYPPPTYMWVREQEDSVITPIDPATNPRYTVINGRLIINRPATSSKDDGKYMCRTSNVFGAVFSNAATLKGGYLLDFPKSPRSPVEATSYQWATIECSPPSHYPGVLYTWYKDDIRNFVRPEVKPYIMVSNDGRLYFSEVTADDIGEYFCVVYKPGQTLSQGKVSMPTTLRVKEGSPAEYEPQIGEGFPRVYPVAPKVGDMLRIECWAYGSSRTTPLVYGWNKVEVQNGQVVRTLPLPSRARLTDHNRVLLIDYVGIYEQGYYQCHVKRVNGLSSSKTVNVILQSIPYFTLGITSQYPDVGTDLRWRCEAEGPPTPQYTWLKNGAVLDNSTILGDDRGRVIVTNNWLTIRNLDAKSDNGMYQCVASNQIGARYSTAELKVLSFAPSFAKRPLQPNLYATVTGNTTMFCRPEAAPFPSIENIIWYKNGSPLNPGVDDTARIRQMPNGNLFIQRVDYTDAGTYRCQVSNSLGQAYTQGNLTVLPTTTVSLPPLDTTIRLNRTSFLHCMASHSPQIDVTYSWYDGNRIVEFEKIFRLGENRYQIWMNPNYMRGTGLFAGGLYIMNAQYEHAGKYTCMVESSSGSISKAANVYVIGPPSPPAGVFIESATVTTTSVVVRWKAAGNNGSPITSYVIEAKNFWEGFWRIVMTNVIVTPDDTDTYRVNVTDLRPYSNYTIRLRAVNKEGTSEPSKASDQFSTSPIVPDLYPELVGGGGGKVGELTLTWKPLEPWQHNALGIGYRVYIKPLGDEQWNWVENVTSSVGIYVKLVGEKNYYLEYEVAVQAFNKIGLGPLSPVVVVRSAMGLPVIIAQNVRAQPFNATACLVHWEPVEDNRENLKGKLGGYRISFWKEVGETELGAQRVTINGQASEGLVIGLYPNTPYFFDVMLWNEAGNGPKSQYFIQRTLRSAPINMPVEVQVRRINYHSIHVKWRGVSTDQQEEPLEGYMIRIWYEGDDVKVAKEYDAEKENDRKITDLRPDIVYKLRVYGYSRGGMGAMSSPTIKFLLGSASTNSVSLVCVCLGLLLSQLVSLV